MAIVYLGIGSNLGDRRANIEKAIALLREEGEIEIQAVSDFIETSPEGGPCLSLPDRQAGGRQAPQGNYLNGALKARTDLLPLELLSRLKTIERRLGRTKSEANTPRPMDLDILFYDDVVIVEGKHLCIPHPRIAERLFVLTPLMEIAPDLTHPRLNRTVKELYENYHERLGT